MSDKNSLKPILVVDDIQPVRETIINILKVLGYKNFLQASNGKEAIEILKKEDVHFIISDWKMPVLNGLELLRWVRANPKTKDTPFLFITSKGDKEDIARAAEEKVTDFIVKPIDVQVFIEKVSSLEKEREKRKKIKEFLKNVKDLIEKGKKEEAENKINEFVAKNRERPNLLVELAKIYKKIDLDRAMKFLNKAIKENPIYFEAWLEVADLYEKLKKADEALKALKKAYEINPNSSNVLYRLGRVYLILNELDKAKNYFYMALKADPKNEELVQNIWNLYLDFELVDRVVKDFEHIIFERLTVKTLNNFAVSLRKSGKIKEAIDAYRQALKKEPQNEHIHYNIAIAYIDLKREDRAIQHLEKALKINPKFEMAAKVLKKLTTLDQKKE